MTSRTPRQELIARNLARRQLIPYCAYVDPDMALEYQHPRMKYLAEKLEAVERGEITRLMIFMPNRHWKSSLVSKKFVSWFIGKRHAEKRPHEVMLVSHTKDKSDEFSEYSRNLVKERNPLFTAVWPEIQISRTRTSAEEWGLLTHEGFEESYPTVKTGSMLAPPVGSGADLLVIDDPVKNSQDARSPAVQKTHLNNYNESLRTRLNDPAQSAVILMMTRWHVFDLAGQLLKLMHDDPMADQWEVVVLPALAYTSKEIEAARRIGIPVPDDDPLGRAPGEALWPERFSVEHHLTTRANSPSAFASIGQQLPIPEFGNLLGRDSFKVLDHPPKENIRWVLCVDAAFAEKQLAKDDPDFNTIGLLGLWAPDKNLLNANVVLGTMVRTQMGLTAFKEVVPRFAAMTEKLIGGRCPIIGDQATLDRVLFNDLRGDTRLFKWSIRSLADRSLKRQIGSFGGDKVTKFEPWRDRVESGRFYVIDEAWSAWALRDAFGGDLRWLFGDEPLVWQEKFYTEVEGFPNWSHDDMVDMVSVGYHYLGQTRPRNKKKAKSYAG